MHKPKRINEVNLSVDKDAGIQPVSTFPSYCVPNCDTCNGTGYVYANVPETHRKHGKLLPCPNLPVESTLLDYCGVSTYERERLNWSSILYDMDETLTEAVEAIKAMIEKRSGVVYLYGGSGLGKSLILKIATVEVLRLHQGMWAQYVHMTRILDRLRMAFDGETPNRAIENMEKDYQMFDLLCIDELGKERDTQFGKERQFILLDKRYEAAIERKEKYMTIIASNLLPSELPSATKSRLWDARCTHIEMQGDDYRLGADV